MCQCRILEWKTLESTSSGGKYLVRSATLNVEESVIQHVNPKHRHCCLLCAIYEMAIVSYLET